MDILLAACHRMLSRRWKKPSSHSTSSAITPIKSQSSARLSAFERLPAEIKNQIYEYTLLSPTGWFYIIWNSASRNRLSITEKLTRKQILDEMAVSLLRVNKKIHQEASHFLYSRNLFHFDFPVDDGFIFDGPHYSHNVIAFLSSLSEPSRKAVNSIRIYAAYRRLEYPQHGWSTLCRYLASKTKITNLTVVVINTCTMLEEAERHNHKLSDMDLPWIQYLTWIQGLKSFNLHTARCPNRDVTEEIMACPSTLPLSQEALTRATFQQVPAMTQHLENFHFNAFYGQPTGTCFPIEFRRRLKVKLGIEDLPELSTSDGPRP